MTTSMPWLRLLKMQTSYRIELKMYRDMLETVNYAPVYPEATSSTQRSTGFVRDIPSISRHSVTRSTPFILSKTCKDGNADVLVY